MNLEKSSYQSLFLSNGSIALHELYFRHKCHEPVSHWFNAYFMENFIAERPKLYPDFLSFMVEDQSISFYCNIMDDAQVSQGEFTFATSMRQILKKIWIHVTVS